MEGAAREGGAVGEIATLARHPPGSAAAGGLGFRHVTTNCSSRTVLQAAAEQEALAGPDKRTLEDGNGGHDARDKSACGGLALSAGHCDPLLTYG